MAYLNTQQTKRPGAAVAVIGIHTALGFALVLGLSGVVSEIIDDGPMPTKTFPTTPPPPPPPPSPDQKAVEPMVDSIVYVPPVENPISTSAPDITYTDQPVFTEYGAPKVVPNPGLGEIVPLDITPPPPAYDPVAASPSNDASNWITLSDYRPRWRREEMTGTVSYRLNVSPNGRVDNCSITRSTGHSAIDQATCKLVTRRARFSAARDGDNRKVSGSYAGTVVWQIPD